MPNIDFPSRSVLLPAWWKQASVIAVGGLLAFTLWTVPNWGEFWSNVSQFPTLWQIPANRKIIIYLTIKVVSPVLIMGIVWMIVCLSALIRSSQDDEQTGNSGRQPAQREEQGERKLSPSIPEQRPKRQDVSFSPQSPVLPASVSSRLDPVTPIPPMLSLSEALRQQGDGDGSKKPITHLTGESHVSLPDPKDENSTTSATIGTSTTLATLDASQAVALTTEQIASSDPLISIQLLKDVSIVINVPGRDHVVVPLTLNAKRVQLLAYIAWRRGELIHREKILEHVFGWGISDEEATEDKLSERFESHKKLLRRKIREVVTEQVNKPAGKQVIDPDLDPFVSDSGFWGLSGNCRVDDLETIEACHRVISLARKNGKLVEEVPEDVKQACERLIASYSGDFLDRLLKKYPHEFRSWQGRSSWIRKPLTLYRDYYLDALWYSAQYESNLGQRYAEEHTSEADQRKLQEHYGRAAQLYQTYAMYACNTRFDAKVTFGAHGEYGERIGMSERALRRCVVLLGAIGKTDLINQIWSAYSTQMKGISDQRWRPSEETQADVQAAMAQTNAYRFAAQISQMSSEFAERHGYVS